MVYPLLFQRWRKPCAKPTVWLAAFSTAALTAHAQPAAQPAKPDPLNPQVSVPPLSYQSSFAQYRRLDDSRPISWREANDTVARIGGWRVYAREAQPHVGPNDTAQPMPAAHSDHKTP